MWIILSLYYGVTGEFDVDRQGISVFPFVVTLVSLLASFLGMIAQNNKLEN